MTDEIVDTHPTVWLDDDTRAFLGEIKAAQTALKSGQVRTVTDRLGTLERLVREMAARHG